MRAELRPCPSDVSSYEMSVSNLAGSEAACFNLVAECFDFFSVAEIKDTELAIKLAIINIIVIVNTVFQIFVRAC